MPIADYSVRIKKNIPLNAHYYLLSFECKELAHQIQPGQFLNLKLNNEGCFLRRPFSVYDIESDEIKLLYMVVGHGTLAMISLKPGDQLDVLGPLGKGFTFPPKNSKIILMAGGTGIGSIYLFYRELLRKKYDDLTFAVGFRRAEFFFPDLKQPKIIIYTQDGSLGRAGFVTDILNFFPNKSDAIYACGPHGMLKTIYDKIFSTPCFSELSLEEIMACGVGACLGCVTETASGRKTVCKYGPIFNLQEFKELSITH